MNDCYKVGNSAGLRGHRIPIKNKFYRFPHGADTDLPHMAKFPNKLQLMPGERS